MLWGFSKPYSNEGIVLVTSTDYFLKPVWNQSDEGSMVLVIQSLASAAHFTGPRCSKLDAEVKRRSKKMTAMQSPKMFGVGKIDSGKKIGTETEIYRRTIF